MPDRNARSEFQDHHEAAFLFVLRDQERTAPGAFVVAFGSHEYNLPQGL
jgi:hypothetical protein